MRKFTRPSGTSKNTALARARMEHTGCRGRAEAAVAGKYCQLGELATGSAIELSGTIIAPFGAKRGRLEPNAFENALFLWEAAQQHACTTYQSLLQTPFMLPAVGRLKNALAALK